MRWYSPWPRSASLLIQQPPARLAASTAPGPGRRRRVLAGRGAVDPWSRRELLAPTTGPSSTAGRLRVGTRTPHRAGAADPRPGPRRGRPGCCSRCSGRRAENRHPRCPVPRTAAKAEGHHRRGAARVRRRYRWRPHHGDPGLVVVGCADERGPRGIGGHRGRAGTSRTGTRCAAGSRSPAPALIEGQRHPEYTPLHVAGQAVSIRPTTARSAARPGSAAGAVVCSCAVITQAGMLEKPMPARSSRPGPNRLRVRAWSPR